MSLFTVIKRGLNRYKVIALFLVMFFIVMFAYYQESIENYGLYTTELRSAYESSLVGSLDTRYIIFILSIVGPLIVSFAFGDIYFEDLESNCIPIIFTRERKEKYHRNNIIAVFILSFLITFIPLIINLVLSLITYPLEGMDNMYHLPAYVIKYNKENIFEYLRVFHPLAYNLICTNMISIVFALFSCITYVISMVIKFNKYVCCILSYSLYLGYNTLVQKIGMNKYSIFNYIDVGEKPNATIFIGIIIGLVIIIIIMYFIGINREIEG